MVFGLYGSSGDLGHDHKQDTSRDAPYTQSPVVTHEPFAFHVSGQTGDTEADNLIDPPYVRTAPPTTSSRPRSTKGDDLQKRSSVAGPSRLLAVVDKDLPPIPRSGSVSFDLSTRTPAPRPTLARSASVLAFTSLPLSVGPSHPDPAALSPSLPVNLRQNAPSSQPRPASTFELFQSMASPMFPASSNSDQTDSSADDGPRRTRGISFGSLSFLSLAVSDFKGKGKEPGSQSGSDAQKPRSPPASPRPLSRKSSFWRKNKSSELLESVSRQSLALPSPILPPTSTHAPPQLPPLPHLTSFNTFGIDGIPQSTTPPPVGDSQASTHASSTSNAVVFPARTPDATIAASNPSGQARRRAQTNPNIISLPARHEVDHPLPRAPTLPRLSNSLPLSSMNVPRPDGDTPRSYLDRLRTVVEKKDLASTLASSSEQVYTEALQLYLQEFDFHNEPLDIALRKLLMDVGLPRETQQIDRVVEAFASRYSTCNPDLFSSNDQAYILAFSLIMLHTDAFNKSNKTKMSKADYVKNATLPGTFPEVLGCFYDNVVFSPFIFIEDPLDSTTKQRTPSTPTTGILKPKVDPYYLIANDLLDSMRADVERIFPFDDPFTFMGSTGRWDAQDLVSSFSGARSLMVETPSRGSISAMDAADKDEDKEFLSPHAEHPKRPYKSLQVIRAGMLNRKDDITGQGKRASARKWRPWSTVLTGSQMLFFRDVTVATQLDPAHSPSSSDFASGRPFQPDDILPLRNAIALFDRSYTKHPNVFRFILPDGRQILLQASDVDDMDDWITKINYVGTFKSTGVSIPPGEMSDRDVCMTGVAAATSHLHDLQMHTAPPPAPSPWDSNTPRELMGMLSTTALKQRPPQPKHKLTIPDELRDLDLETVSTIESAKSEQFEATFQQVKADLAHTRSPPLRASLGTATPSFQSSHESISRTSRHDLIQQRIVDLKAHLSSVNSELEEHMRFLRNVAILRPLQRATRTKLITAVQPFVASKRLSFLRIETQRLQCQIMVLEDDVRRASSAMESMKTKALDVAKQTLQQRRSDNVDYSNQLFPSLSRREGSSSLQPHSRQSSGLSLTDSFYSAVESGSDWPEDSDRASPSSMPASPYLTPSTHTRSGTSTDTTDPQKVIQRSSSTDVTGGSQKEGSQPTLSSSDEEPEEAEPWNRTRAAKRVSLIRVPSSVAFTKRTSPLHP